MTYTFDTNKAYHQQELYKAAREALKEHDIVLRWTEHDEHKFIAKGDFDSLKAQCSFAACIEEFPSYFDVI